MTVRIFIKRHCKEGQVQKTLSMLNQFRKAAMDQPGYLSGETLVSHFDSRCIVVVSTWRNVDDWINWQNSATRDRNETRMEDLLDKPTKYEVFDISSTAD